MASGRFGKGKSYDSSYWFGRLSGAGRGGDLSDADGFWMARYQWNCTRRVLAFSPSDIGKREDAAGSVALAFVDGKSSYTSFSGQGGGQLPGFSDGDPDQYAIRRRMTPISGSVFSGIGLSSIVEAAPTMLLWLGNTS